MALDYDEELSRWERSEYADGHSIAIQLPYDHVRLCTLSLTPSPNPSPNSSPCPNPYPNIYPNIYPYANPDPNSNTRLQLNALTSAGSRCSFNISALSVTVLLSWTPPIHYPSPYPDLLFALVISHFRCYNKKEKATGNQTLPVAHFLPYK